jgi:ATP-dependent RNA helicase RhlB
MTNENSKTPSLPSEGAQSVTGSPPTALELDRVIPVSDVVHGVDSFLEAGIDQAIVDAAASIGWTAPTPVQGMCLPLTVKGRDVAGFAQTGTGKTGVFILTVAQRMLNEKAPERLKKDVAIPEVVVLTPTRELTMQIDDDAKRVLEPLGIKSMPVFGGVDIEKQANQLKAGPRMIVATPGRLKDFHQRKVVDLSQVKIFICDEADRMFDMGFIDDVEFFLDKIPENAQKLLFSATTNDNVKELAFEYLNQPAYISVNPEVLTPEKIEQHSVICDSSNKLRVILGLFREHNPECAIVFTNTKMVAEWLHFKLCGNGIEADLITGDLPQSKRIALIHRIKEGKVKALIATDVASRGLHISKVSHVYNFDVPEDPANYVHRIGRTARAGASGRSYTLVCEDYGENMIAVEEMLGPQLSPKAEWFNQDYLSIKDETGNPYAQGAALYRNPKDRDDKRKGAFARDDKGPRRDKAPSAPNRNKPIAFQGDRPQRGPQHGDRPKKHHPRGPSHTRPNVSTNLQPIDRDPGVFGWIKRIFKAIFG